MHKEDMAYTLFIHNIAFYLRIMGYFHSIGGLKNWEDMLKPIESGDSIPIKALSRYYITETYLITYYVPVEQTKYINI
jgi:hypothetical protein